MTLKEIGKPKKILELSEPNEMDWKGKKVHRIEPNHFTGFTSF